MPEGLHHQLLGTRVDPWGEAQQHELMDLTGRVRSPIAIGR
jgi:hypothetical protein